MADCTYPDPVRVSTWFSTGPENEEINRVIEQGYDADIDSFDADIDSKGFIHYEFTLGQCGRQFGYSLLSGLGRMAFGLAQIVGTVFFAIIRLIQAGFARICGDKELAILRASEALRSITYFGHGLANFGRGLVEAVQIMALAQCCGYFVSARDFLYQSEKAEMDRRYRAANKLAGTAELR